ncbi:MAG: glycosyltransferase family 1 protein [Terriglobales bacterium]
MIRLFINGLAASAGGGLTYLRNVIPQLARRDDVHATVLLNPTLRREFEENGNVSFVEMAGSDGAPQRLIREQTALPALIRRSGAQVLISTGNFALWRSPVPQILLSRNSLYISDDFMRDLRARGDHAIWIDTLAKAWFARQSIRRADITIAPSAAFASELARWSGREVAAIHHGFDAAAFVGKDAPLLPEVRNRLDDGRDALRLLFVSHYNYYRNFETLFRAMPFLNRRLKERGFKEKTVKLYLTCRLSARENPGSYRTGAASAVLNEVRASCEIVELGAIPYSSLHHLYRACHIYVTPAYAESFAHPLVEAMSSGLPVVASDLEVHREICGSAALYFPRFSPEELAERLFRIYESPELARKMSCDGLRRAQDFSWETHVSRLLLLAEECIGARAGANREAAGRVSTQIAI